MWKGLAQAESRNLVVAEPPLPVTLGPLGRGAFAPVCVSACAGGPRQPIPVCGHLQAQGHLQVCQLLPTFQHLGNLSLEAPLLLLQGLHGQLQGKREVISKGQGPACQPAHPLWLQTEHLLLLPVGRAPASAPREPSPEPWRRDPLSPGLQAPPLRMLARWPHSQLGMQLPQEGRREGGREMGYREERGKVEAEGKTITQRPGRQDRRPNCPVPAAVFGASRQAPPPPRPTCSGICLLPRRGGRGGGHGQPSVRPRQGAVFSAADPICAVQGGAAVPGFWNVLREWRSLIWDKGRRPLVQGPSPPPVGEGEAVRNRTF